MNDSLITIKKIWQHDNYTLGVLWHDQSESLFRLSDIQNHCPCADCVDELTGQRRRSPMAHPDLKAHKVRAVGRYGLAFEFTSGCSLGIYSFDMLYKIAR